MTTKRTFIAIEFPEDLTQTIGRFVQSLRADLERQKLAHTLRFVNPHNIHLTLRFLGDTNAEQINAVAHGLPQLLAEYQPFDLTVQGLGCFPNVHQPTVIWTALHGDSAQLNRLQQAVERLVQGIGFVAERKIFQPHITLARVERNASAAEVRRLSSWLEQITRTTVVQEWSAALHVTQISFIESTLKPNGAIYATLGKFLLSY